jgi:hypothetical protein
MIFIGITAPEYVLLPKTGALQVCLEQMREHVSVIYDVTIAYGNTMNSAGTRQEAPGMPGMKALRITVFFLLIF